ncbi:hypothetical protein HPB47_022338 [Ixodes persulcatus]|uniref:Uncharacterized protein n=1 Tax=Ixodes persulcatus TaxID=34615 RepID=A0AC60QA05_IXOPE|nr:hypothetical protein HPB47_022338 [Ixodes persulcatus]
MYRNYLPKVYEHDLETIKEAVKNRPISLTIDEMPELRGQPAVAVLVTLYDDEALLGQWTHASVTSFGREVDCMLDIVDEEKRSYAVNSFREDHGSVAKKWSCTVQRNIADDLQYTSDSFWYWVHIVNPNVNAELPHMFEIYKHLFTLVVQRGHDITQLEREFLAYQSYAVKEIKSGPSFHVAH